MLPARAVAPASATPRRTLPARCLARDRRRPARQTRKQTPCPESGSLARQKLRVVPLERYSDQPRGERYRERLSLLLLGARINDKAYQPERVSVRWPTKIPGEENI